MTSGESWVIVSALAGIGGLITTCLVLIVKMARQWGNLEAQILALDKKVESMRVDGQAARAWLMTQIGNVQDRLWQMTRSKPPQRDR